MKACTKMTAAELAAATAEYDKPVAPKSLRPMSAPERVKWKNAIRGPGRPRIGKGAVNALISFEMGLLSRADVFATSHGVGRSKLVAVALESWMARHKTSAARGRIAG